MGDVFIQPLDSVSTSYRSIKFFVKPSFQFLLQCNRSQFYDEKNRKKLQLKSQRARGDQNTSSLPTHIKTSKRPMNTISVSTISLKKTLIAEARLSATNGRFLHDTRGTQHWRGRVICFRTGSQILVGKDRRANRSEYSVYSKLIAQTPLAHLVGGWPPEFTVAGLIPGWGR